MMPIQALRMRNSGSAIYTPSAPTFSNVKLLVGADTSLVDESSGAHTLTPNVLGSGPAPSRDTGTAKFGAASVKFPAISGGINGGSVLVPDSADWDIGTGAFTIESWIDFHTHNDGAGVSAQVIASHWGSTNPDCGWYWMMQTFGTPDVMEFGYMIGSTVHSFQDSAADFTLDTFYHLAVDCDAGGTLRLFRNGVMTGKTTVSAGWNTSSNPMQLGARWALTNNALSGWMDEFRLTKGQSIYGSDTSFTVPTGTFPRS